MSTFPKGAAAILAEKDLLGSLVTTERNPTTVVGVQNILGGDAERTIMLLYNLSAGEIYVGFSPRVSASNGMLIPAAGGFIIINAVDDYETVTMPIYVFSAAAGNQLYITTTRRETGLNGE